jgi:photosystem II stability/assembly factor-like uncharacterized protein
MKNILKITLLVCWVTCINAQNSGWLVQASGVTAELYSVHFENGLTGWSSGAGGVILKTTNGGNSWLSQPSGVSINLLAIYFTSVNTGWAAGESGVILKTTNGGDSWQTQNSGVTSSIKCMWFSDANTGYSAGGLGKILKTTNGGAVWINQPTGITSDINSIMFVNTNTGWASGNAGKILKTTNGGGQWTINIDHGPVSDFFGLYFSNSMRGTAIGRYVDQGGPFVYFYKTDNGGNWWEYLPAQGNSILRSVYFADSLSGWAAGDSGKVYGTINKGVTWIEQNSRTLNTINSVYFISNTVGFAVGKNGTIIKTSHGGFRDTILTNRRDLGVIALVENVNQLLNAKYRVQFKMPDTSYNILRSFNNGISFDTLLSNLTLLDTGRYIDGMLVRVKKIKFSSGFPSGNYSGNVGVIQDPNPLVDTFQSRFRGWDYFPQQNNPYDSTRFAINPTYKPYQSRSLSISYPTRNTYIGFRSLLNPENLRKVKIVFTGYGSGQQAYRYLSTGAVNFTYQDMREVPFKVYEVDETDGTSQPRQLNCAFLEFPGSAQDNKWEPATDSTGGKEVLYIFNSSYNPQPDSFYVTKNLYLQMATVDVMYVWAPRRISANANFQVNDELYIYPYTVTRPEIAPGYPLYYEFKTESVIAIEPISTVIPEAFSLKQNYPNPFNPVTKIKFSLPLKQQVNIKIFDILGKQTAEIVNTALTAGEYEIEWDASKLASGIYFCRFESDKYSYTIKMALIK